MNLEAEKKIDWHEEKIDDVDVSDGEVPAVFIENYVYHGDIHYSMLVRHAREGGYPTVYGLRPSSRKKALASGKFFNLNDWVKDRVEKVYTQDVVDDVRKKNIAVDWFRRNISSDDTMMDFLPNLKKYNDVVDEDNDHERIINDAQLAGITEKSSSFDEKAFLADMDKALNDDLEGLGPLTRLILTKSTYSDEMMSAVKNQVEAEKKASNLKT